MAPSLGGSAVLRMNFEREDWLGGPQPPSWSKHQSFVMGFWDADDEQLGQKRIFSAVVEPCSGSGAVHLAPGQGCPHMEKPPGHSPHYAAQCHLEGGGTGDPVPAEAVGAKLVRPPLRRGHLWHLSTAGADANSQGHGG